MPGAIFSPVLPCGRRLNPTCPVHDTTLHYITISHSGQGPSQTPPIQLSATQRNPCLSCSPSCVSNVARGTGAAREESLGFPLVQAGILMDRDLLADNGRRDRPFFLSENPPLYHQPTHPWMAQDACPMTAGHLCQKNCTSTAWW